MRLLPLLALALLVPTSASGGAGGDTFVVFKCSVSLPVVHSTTNAKGHVVLATFKLDSADIVNLALGRPLDTKLDPQTEVLAWASDVTTPGAGSQIVVFDPGTDTITALVCDSSAFVLVSDEDFSKNAAFANLELQATSLGEPLENGFADSTLSAAGTGKNSGSFSSTALAGPVSFKFTEGGETTTIEGVVTKGKLKVSGPQLAFLGP
jgi:hypothetical protein